MSMPFPRARRAVARLAVLTLTTAVPVLASQAGVDAAGPVTHAISTTTNTAASTGNGACLHGPSGDPTNCNLYASKEDVWISGLPSSLADGTYFFAVLSPGGQPGPNDGDAGNLSDDVDGYANRTFTMSGGSITGTSGSHLFQLGKLQAADFADSPNNGGVYIMAVCKISAPNSYPAKASDCKYDAFKVRDSANPSASPLVVTKDAAGAYDRTYTWTIQKSVNRTLVKTTATTASFAYSVLVDANDGVISDVTVAGTITVFNPNDDSVTGVNVTDTLSDSTTCTVTGGTNATVTSGDNLFPYTCSLTGLPDGQLDNTADATWSAQSLTDGSLAAGNADFTFPDVGFTGTDIDECVTVTDTYAGTLGTLCASAAPHTYTYNRVVAVPRDTCATYDNTATFTTNDTAATGTSSQSVQACGPITGGHTMGFWQNNNGQGIIKTGAATAGVCNSGTWLRGYAPFQDLSTSATCAQVATYVNNVIKSASAGGAAMNAMLKGQMLATALAVYFSDPALGGNKIGAPQPLGGRTVDLALMGASAAFGGATSLTVNQMLTYAASQSNVGGSTWYGQNKAIQGLAKTAFDTINNNGAFAP